MIIRVESKEQFDICLNIIHKSFQTVADEMNLTKDNCPSYTAFMPIFSLQFCHPILDILVLKSTSVSDKLQKAWVFI